MDRRPGPQPPHHVWPWSMRQVTGPFGWIHIYALIKSCENSIDSLRNKNNNNPFLYGFYFDPIPFYFLENTSKDRAANPY